MKGLFSVLFAALMVVTVLAPAFAADEPESPAPAVPIKGVEGPDV
jgi:hypothetical protein